MVEKNRQENESLCEKSMQLMLNIIKLSSISLATVNLRDKPGSDEPVNLVAIESVKANSKASLMTKSYLVEEDTGDHQYPLNSTSRSIDDDDDDGYFSDYIKKFHTRTKNEVNTDGKVTAHVRKFPGKNSPEYALAAPIVRPRQPPSFRK